MPCFHPMRAWRTQAGQVILAREPDDAYQLRLPCGNCLGCRMAKAKAWALRCHLELQQHPSAIFSTLTYDDKHLPPTLERRHLQLFFKRLRKRSGPNRIIRFFASGEYGERTERAHYHAIIFGLSVRDRDLVQSAWSLGGTRSYNATPAAIAYTAGYTSKKIGYKKLMADERVDPETGEVYTWQPPFLQMSRRPGIGGHARQWPESWRLFAIHNGQRMPVPRFYHEAWKAQASPSDLEELHLEKIKLAILKDSSPYRLQAAEKLAIARQSLQSARRSL